MTRYDGPTVAQQRANREAADLPMFRSSDPETSREAAAKVAPHVTKLQARVLDAFRKHGPMCAKRAERLAEFSDLGFSTVRKRISELHQAGHLVRSGVRDGGTVYAVADR